MVDQVNGVGAGQHVAPQKGMKMSDLKEKNKLLFDYFKQNGVDENQFITEDFIANAKSTLDRNDNGKISVSEARKMGINGTRKEVKAAIGMLDTIANTEIGKDVEVSEAVDDKNTDYYKNGVRTKSVYKDENNELVKEYEGDGRTLKEVRGTHTKDGVTTTAKTVYSNGSKLLTNIEDNKQKTSHYYNPTLGDERPTKSVVTLKNDKGELDNDSTKTIVYSNYGEGKARTETITYEGEMIEDGITQRVIEYDAEGNEISNTTNLDAAEKADEAAAAKDGADVTAKDETAPEAAKDGAKTRPAFVKPQHKVSLPKEWDKKRLPDGVAEELKLADTYTADEVLDKLSEKFGINKAEVQMDKLKADLIKYNPSVFDKEGNVFEGAKFAEKLDFPPNAKDLYKQGAEPPKAPTRPAAPARPVRPARPAKPAATEEVKASTTPVIPRDPNPPKQDASGMIIYQAHATGPKNGTMGDINGNVYQYDENGRLKFIRNKEGYTTHEYSYDYDGKLKNYAEYNDQVTTRDNQGRVIEYYDNEAKTYRFGNGVAQPQNIIDENRLAEVKDFNLNQKQFERDNKARNKAEQQRTQRNAQIVKQARADRAKKTK